MNKKKFVLGGWYESIKHSVVKLGYDWVPAPTDGLIKFGELELDFIPSKGMVIRPGESDLIRSGKYFVDSVEYKVDEDLFILMVSREAAGDNNAFAESFSWREKDVPLKKGVVILFQYRSGKFGLSTAGFGENDLECTENVKRWIPLSEVLDAIGVDEDD